MLRKNQSMLRLISGLVCCNLLVLVSIAAPPPGKGKPGGDDPTDPLPPVAFDLTFLPISWPCSVKDLNNHRQVVGNFRQADGHDTGFVYDHDTGALLTLNDLLSPDDAATIAARGYNDSKFWGINDAGLIVGYAGITEGGGSDYSEVDGIVIDLVSGSLTWSSSLGLVDSYLTKINNSNDVCGGFWKDDSWWNAFVAAFDSETDSLQGKKELGLFGDLLEKPLTDSRLWMLNDSSGTWEYDVAADQLRLVFSSADSFRPHDLDSIGRYAGINRTTRNGYGPAVLVDPQEGNAVLQQSVRNCDTCLVNDPSATDLVDGIVVGDLVYRDYVKKGRRQIYIANDTWGEMRVDDLIDPADADLAAWLEGKWSLGHLSEKTPDTNFGVIAGKGPGGAYILVPKPFAR